MPSLGARLAMSVIAAVVIYGNLAVTFHPSKLGLPDGIPGLPRPRPLLDAFLIPGMFSGHSSANFDFVIEGRRASDHRYVELDVREHFPLRMPITYTQVFAAHHWDILGASEQRRVWASYARKIEARHNRLHPDARIERVRFGVVSFPQSDDGYRAKKPPGGGWKTLWYADP
jgi:hypothetical protein